MIKQLQCWWIFGNSAYKQLIAFVSLNKRIIVCTKLLMNKSKRKIYKKDKKKYDAIVMETLKVYSFR